MSKAAAFSRADFIVVPLVIGAAFNLSNISKCCSSLYIDVFETFRFRAYLNHELYGIKSRQYIKREIINKDQESAGLESENIFIHTTLPSPEHLRASLQLFAQDVPSRYGPFGQLPWGAARAMAVRASAVKTVKICIIAGGGKAWGLKVVIYLVFKYTEVCMYVCFSLRVWNDRPGKERRGQTDCFLYPSVPSPPRIHNEKSRTCEMISALVCPRYPIIVNAEVLPRHRCRIYLSRADLHSLR